MSSRPNTVALEEEEFESTFVGIKMNSITIVGDFIKAAVKLPFANSKSTSVFYFLITHGCVQAALEWLTLYHVEFDLNTLVKHTTVESQEATATTLHAILHEAVPANKSQTLQRRVDAIKVNVIATIQTNPENLASKEALIPVLFRCVPHKSRGKLSAVLYRGVERSNVACVATILSNFGPRGTDPSAFDWQKAYDLNCRARDDMYSRNQINEQFRRWVDSSIRRWMTPGSVMKDMLTFYNQMME